MAFQKMTSREQVLILIVVATFVGGAYTLFRFIPQNKIISAQAKQLEEDKMAVKNPVFPDEPDEDIDELKDKEAELSEALLAAQTTLSSYTQNLAPLEGQDAVLRISDAARASNVKVTENIPYLVQRKEAQTQETNKRKLSKRAARKLAKDAREGGGQTDSQGGAVGLVPKEGELIYRLVNDLPNARPLQQIKLEANFYDLQKFMQAISNMQYQITIVKLDVEIKSDNTIPGTPQILLAKMIIAL